MSIIDAIRTFILTNTSLETNAPVWVNYLGSTSVEYNVQSLPGARIVDEYIGGGSIREFPFAFQSISSTADNLARLEALGFFEAFADWLESQTESGTLPTLGAGQTATKIEALGWAYLFQQGESGVGIYQIQCRLEYEQE